MSEYNEGDLVEAVKDGALMSGTLFKSPDNLCIKGIGCSIQWLIIDGWTVTVIEKAPPKNPLPIEPGLYVTDISDPGGVFVLYRLNSHGQWFVMWTMAEAEERTESAMIAGTNGKKLFRLEPVSETAKKVLDRICADCNGDGGYYDHQYTARQLRELFAEFGVGGNE